MCKTSLLLPCRNAAPVLRIIRSPNELVQDPDPLDDTRIHPEHYSLAVRMCAKVLEGSRHTFEDDDEVLMVEQAMQTHRGQILGLDLMVRLAVYRLARLLPTFHLCTDYNIPKPSALIQQMRAWCMQLLSCGMGCNRPHWPGRRNRAAGYLDPDYPKQRRITMQMRYM